MHRYINSFITILLIIVSFNLVGCRNDNKLLLLNWGEYINMDLVEKFENEYNCEVIISLAESNDLFYSKVKSGTTVYDLVVPSDYMVEKMYLKGMLQPIDYHKLGYDSFSDYESIFLPGVIGIINEMESLYPNIKNYFVPYFWGTWGIMYNKKKTGLTEAIEKATDEGNVWKVMFEDNAVPSGTRIGMYETSRYAYAAAMFYNGLSPNLASDEALKIANKTLTNKRFTSWATDTLKKDICHDNLDLGFMWTGDFLDMLYSELETKTLSEISFDIIIPENTVAFCDNFVITKNARHVDLAHQFIKFFLDQNNAYENASIVGYCTPIEAAYDKICKYQNSVQNSQELLAYKDNITEIKVYPKDSKSQDSYIALGKINNTADFIVELSYEEALQLTNIIEEESCDLDPNWLTSWAYAVSKYYPKYVDNEKGFRGTVLTDLDREYIDKINTICNNAKV